MSITWGNTEFSGPEKITNWNPPFRAALYAIMIKPDPVSKPDSFRIIYFGESGNLSERGFYKSHHSYQCWRRQAGTDTGIYIGIHLMPGSSIEQRRVVEQRLIRKYNPSCNK